MPSREILTQMLHTVVYDTCFSPCGRYLAVANKFGQVALFNISTALSSDVSEKSKTPIYTFKVTKGGAIYNLTGTDSLLICAGDAGIIAYKWADIISKSAKPQWSLAVPQKDVFSHPEVNSCVVSEKENNRYLYAGAGDNLIHSWDLETGEHLSSLSGHTAYVHSVALRDKGQGLVSTSEDGTARIWDLRSNQAVHCIRPSEHEVCARPQVGNWLQCLALNEDDYWLLLGGGPTMAAWHLKTLTPMSTFDTPGVSQHVALFHQDKIYSAGSSSVLNHWSLTGEHTMAVPVSPSSIYSLHISPDKAPKRAMVVAGCSSDIDVCTNFGYTAFSLSFTSVS